MFNVNIVDWLSQGPFLIFAVAIGLIVSIDVFGLEYMRDYGGDSQGVRWTQRMKAMGLLHGLFHSLSFWVYTIGIYAMQEIAFFPIDFFDLPEGVGAALLVLINFLVVCFIWWTYRGKIKEDHSEKDTDDSDGLRRDMKILVDAIRAIASKLGLGRAGVRGAAVAGAVAVDMLAVSALLKTYLLPHGESAATATLSGNVWLDVTVFALVVFVVVRCVVFLAQAAGRFSHDCSPILVTSLRLLEPFLVFYIVAGTVRAAMRLAGGDAGDSLGEYSFLIDCAFSVAMVVSLVVSNGMSMRSLLEIYSKRSRDQTHEDNGISPYSFVSRLRAVLPAVATVLATLLIVLISLGYAYSTNPGRETHNHLIEATVYFSVMVLFASIVLLYTPSLRLHKMECAETASMKLQQIERPVVFWSRLLGVSIALFSLNAFNYLVFGRNYETESVSMWTICILMSWLLLDLRRWRFHKFGRSMSDLDCSELVSAISLASCVVALCSGPLIAVLRT